MRYKAVVFDLFGTLVDNSTWPEYQKHLAAMADALSIPQDAFEELWIDTYEERMTGVLPTTESNILHICNILGVNPEGRQLDAAVRTRVEFTRQMLVPRADALPALTLLREAGLKLGLISDCSPEVPLLWDKTPLAGLVAEAVFSCRVGVKKPDPQIYLLACRRLDVLPQECLYVGDSAGELNGAAWVGMFPVLIRVPHEAIQALGPIHDDMDTWEGPTISSISEVRRLVSDS